MGWGWTTWRRRLRPATPPVAALRSDVGRVRRINEDRVLGRPEAGLWAVSDGMGGMHAGDVAAQAVVDALAAAELTSNTIVAALSAANAAVHAAGAGRSGATVVAALVSEREAMLFWAGDSRAYHVRGASVRQVTRDHSVVQDMVDAGLLAAEEADSHPRSNVITRAIGVAPAVAVDRVRVELARGDRLFLCSDGVSRTLRLDDLAAREPVEPLADRLLAAALDRDGSDNASLILIEV